MTNIEAYKDYLPDNIELSKLSRKFLLSVSCSNYINYNIAYSFR